MLVSLPVQPERPAGQERRSPPDPGGRHTDAPVLQRLDECPEAHLFLRQFTDDIDPHDAARLGDYKLVVNAWGTFSSAMEPLVKHVDTIAPQPGTVRPIASSAAPDYPNRPVT